MDIVVYSDRTHLDEVQPNIVVPYIDDGMTFQATRLNLEVQGLRPRYERLDSVMGADWQYARLFSRLWENGEPFILVEHDILPWPGALAELWECERAWCGFGYYVFGEVRSYLGCTKFSPMRLGPLPFEGVIQWSMLDQSVVKELISRGHDGHLHGPPVIHLNAGHKRVTADLSYITGAIP